MTAAALLRGRFFFASGKTPAQPRVRATRLMSLSPSQRKMSASQLPALDAIAFQLVAALDCYDEDVTRMLDDWPDVELYRRVGEQMGRIRMYSSALAEARVQWVELLIAHSELVHCLWRRAEGHEPKEPVEQARDRHADAVAALRRRCIRLASRTGTT
jgi:hypothetical protein